MVGPTMANRPPITQYTAPDGWAVARDRTTDHAYLVTHHGAYVGWLTPTHTGWRWLTTWRPGRPGRPVRVGERSSSRTYDTWQQAAAALARTDTARAVAGSSRPGEWSATAARPWTPTPAPDADLDDPRVW